MARLASMCFGVSDWLLEQRDAAVAAQLCAMMLILCSIAVGSTLARWTLSSCREFARGLLECCFCPGSLATIQFSVSTCSMLQARILHAATMQRNVVSFARAASRSLKKI